MATVVSELGGPFGELGVTLGFSASQVVIGVRGEVDLLTAAELGAVVDAVIDRGHGNLVLDLAEMAFIDCFGLRVIAAASTRLRPAGRVLVLRSTSPWTRRILDITGVVDLVQFERTDPILAPLGPEQRAGDGSDRVLTHPGAARSDLARFAAIPANGAVVDAALRLVVALARATVGGADGVSVSVSRQGRIETVAWSDETIAQMDRDQYATGQGPCLAAAAEGHWFHIESLAEENRWPEFTPRAIAGGIASILSTPLLVAARPVGALNIYSNAERVFGPTEQELAALFATQASAILTDAGVDISSEKAGLRIQDALRSREVIAQAQGVIMERSGVSASAAYVALRRLAVETGTTLRHTAIDLVASSLVTLAPPGGNAHG